MKALEQKIISEGKIFEGDVLKVDCFLNHQIDVAFLNEIGKEFFRLYQPEGINKILTIEASGIGVACVTALNFDPALPVVFAKKSSAKNVGANLYQSKVESYTHGRTYDVVVSKDYLKENDRVLIIDDFLAKGSALMALTDLCRQAKATVIGIGIVIEKAYQGGGALLRQQGFRIESLAKIESMNTVDGIIFANPNETNSK
ncbi:MAG: xanthine phosphoribosyltransferase [Clostridia bacterium]|nr:xanthine phosphoribosyltransferase [Clostridia bacterium]